MKMNNLRWWVITPISPWPPLINYIDRQSLNVLWPAISADIYPDKSEDERKNLRVISVVFVFAYAFGQAILARYLIGLALAWASSDPSVSGLSQPQRMHWRVDWSSFSIFRAILGVAEAGNWPGATKGNAEWFPTKRSAPSPGYLQFRRAIGE